MDVIGSWNFRGRDLLEERIDAAVQAGGHDAIVHALERVLQQAIIDPLIGLPPCVLEPIADHYARRELLRSARHGYSVIAMTWGPGQGTPLHDHSGLWCVEGVWQGCLEITPYRMVEDAGEIAHLTPERVIQSERGSAGSLIPPHEYHTIRNACPEQIAVSVHVYEGVMEHSTLFLPIAGRPGWYRRESLAMAIDGCSGETVS